MSAMTDERAHRLPVILLLTVLLLVDPATPATNASATSAAEHNPHNAAVVDTKSNNVTSTPIVAPQEDPSPVHGVPPATAEDPPLQVVSNTNSSSPDTKHSNASAELPTTIASSDTNSTTTPRTDSTTTTTTESTTTPPTDSTTATTTDSTTKPPTDSTTTPTPVDPSIYIKNVYLWTRGYKDGGEYELLDLHDNTTLVNSHFKPAAPTFVLVHGFLSYGLILWIEEAKQKLLGLSNCNVISIDWDAGNTTSPKAYNTVTSHVPYVGSETAQLLLSLYYLKQLDTATTHLIGHSLGAHVAGFAAKKSHSPIGRITGLDPADISYRDAEANMRLDKSDAIYVDIIHTNACNNRMKWTDCFGIKKSIGDTDFWPNGGEYQPACKKLGHKHGHKGQLDCDHQMAHDYYVESLDYGVDDTLFLARPAKNYWHYCNDPKIECGRYPQYMGYNAIQHSIGDYFFNTTHVPPYAVLDPACPSRLSYRLSIGSSVSAIVALIAIAVLIVLRFVTSNVSLHTGTSYSTLVDDGINGNCATAGQQRVHTYSPRNDVVIPDALDDVGVETRVITDDPLLPLRRHIENQSEPADDLDNLDMFSATDEFPNARLPLISDFGPDDLNSAADVSQDMPDSCGADLNVPVPESTFSRVNREHADGIHVDPILAPFVDVTTVDVTLSDDH